MCKNDDSMTVIYACRRAPTLFFIRIFFDIKPLSIKMSQELMLPFKSNDSFIAKYDLWIVVKINKPVSEIRKTVFFILR